MPFDPSIHDRRSVRLKAFDYAGAGAYFVAVCTHDREFIFGDVCDGQVCLNERGRIVETCWTAIPHHFARVSLDLFVVMPNHLHGIVVITEEDHLGTDGSARAEIVGARHASPLRSLLASPMPAAPAFPREINSTTARGTGRGSLGAIVGSFKSASTKRLREVGAVSRLPIWQRNYFEHVIRDDPSLARIREYISTNPTMWDLDPDNPSAKQVT